QHVLIDDHPVALLRLEPRTLGRKKLSRLRVGRVFIPQTAEQLPAAPGDLRRISRVLLDLGHIHRDAAELLEVAPAAELQTTMAGVAHEARLVPGPDLLELDPRPELVREEADEFAEVDPRRAGEVEDDPLAA